MPPSFGLIVVSLRVPETAAAATSVIRRAARFKRRGALVGDSDAFDAPELANKASNAALSPRRMIGRLV